MIKFLLFYRKEDTLNTSLLCTYSPDPVNLGPMLRISLDKWLKKSNDLFSSLNWNGVMENVRPVFVMEILLSIKNIQ